MVVVVVESSTSAAPLELTFEANEQISIGRDPKCGVQLPDASVSLRHALLRPGPSGYVVVDENSTNGTFLNSTRLSAGASKPLSDGDDIRVGRARLRVSFRSPSAAPKAAFSTQDIALAMVQGALIQSGTAVAPRVSVIEGPDRGRELVLYEERSYVLGRDDDVDLKLSDDDASRRHTRVVRRGARLWVIDLGSKNGTRLDGRRLRPNVAEAWSDTAVLELGRNQFGIDDPVSSALRGLERAPDERLGSDWPPPTAAAVSSSGSLTGAESRGRFGAPVESRKAFASVNEPKGVLSLSTSSSSSGPSAPIEVVPFRESEPPKKPEKPRTPWSFLDALVVGVAVVTVALSALALAWFLVS